jgi:small subunit ribosomal protein S2
MAEKVITTEDLLEAGVHFGHQTKRWNPQMKRFILDKKNGIHIIDPRETVKGLNESFDFLSSVISKGGKILFIGTKKQAQEPLQNAANRVGMPYVTERWLGGMITNFETISKRLGRLAQLETLDFDAPSVTHTKKELLLLRREKDKLEKVLGGIKSMKKVPEAVFIVDTNKEHLAIKEAHKLGIPVIAIADTNCDPNDIDYIIPGNDDAIASIQLISEAIADAVAEGTLHPTVTEKPVTTGDGESGAAPVAADEELSDWEKELMLNK